MAHAKARRHEDTKTRRMGFLEKLLDLPDGEAGDGEVEWMPLGNLGELVRGTA